MSYREIKYSKDGRPYIDCEFRRKNPKTKEIYKRNKRIYLEMGLTQSKLNKQAEKMHNSFIDECEEEMKLGIKTDLSYEEFCKIYLKHMQENLNLSTFARNEPIAKYLVEELRTLKLIDLTPEIVRNLYSKINKLTKKVVQYFPKDNFNQILEDRGLNYTIMRRMMGIQHYTLRKALDGKNVGKSWAENFSKELGVSACELFDIKEEDIEIAYNTKMKYISFFKASLSFAVKNGYIAHNYASSDYIEPIKNKDFNKKGKCMDAETYLKFYNYISTYPDLRIKNVFLILLNTGMRKEELLGLKWENINFQEKKMIIENVVTYVSGKGIQFRNGTKNYSSTRTIAISDEVLESLKEYKIFCKTKMQSEEYLFKKADGNFIFPQTINYWLNKVLDELKLEHYTVHSLRHSYITYMLEVENAPLISVSKRAGHSRPSTTTDMYGHVISSNDRKIANAFINEKK